MFDLDEAEEFFQGISLEQKGIARKYREKVRAKQGGVEEYWSIKVFEYVSTHVLAYSNTPVLTYSSAHILQYSHTPVLTYSNTPLLIFSSTPASLLLTPHLRKFRINSKNFR